MPTWSSWLRRRGDVTPEASQRLEFEGRKLLGNLMQRVRAGGLGQLVHTVEYPDGAVIEARWDGVTPTVTVKFNQAAPPQAQALVESTLWVPNGFVVYPSSADSVGGWGAPVQQVGTDPYATSNVAPGTDVSRWTISGKLGEVFITKQTDAGYPKKDREVTPLFYSTTEKPVEIINLGDLTIDGASQFKPAPLQSTWASYRMEFNNFTGSGGEGGTNRQVLFTGINDLHEYLLPIRGYYDPAARAVRYAQSTDFTPGIPWVNDHDLPGAPTGYKKSDERHGKDGQPDSIAHETITNASDLASIVADLRTEAHLADGTFTQESRVSLEIAQRNGLSAVVATERSQWIACGNRYWIGDDAALPQVSWDGFPSWNWPQNIAYGDLSGGNYVDLDTYKVKIRGTLRSLFTKRICARGREIGTLPDFVLSAGVQTRVESGKTIDRLVVLTWRLSDQDAFDPFGGSDYNRVTRVYYVDTVRRNGLALAFDHAVNGLYNATTNPDGWRFAGTLDLWIHSPAFASWYYGLAQQPAFSGDGKRCAYMVFLNDGAGDILSASTETVFDNIDDGVLTTHNVIMDPATRYDPPVVIFGASAIIPIAIDYNPRSINLSVVNVVTSTFVDEPGGPYEGQLVRWSGNTSSLASPTTGDLVFTSNAPHSPDFAFIAANVLDVRSGAIVGLGHHTAPSAQMQAQYSRKAAATVSTTFTDTSGITYPETHAQELPLAISVAVTSYASLGSDFISGYEVVVFDGVSTYTFLGAEFDTSFGNLAAVTHTPGTSPRFWPVCAV